MRQQKPPLGPPRFLRQARGPAAPLRLAAAALVAASLGSPAALAGGGTVFSVYAGPPGWSWSLPSSWVPPQVPDNFDPVFYVPTIPAGGWVTLSSPVSVNGLTLGAGAHLGIEDGFSLIGSGSLTVMNAPVLNDGLISLSGASAATTFRIIGTVELAGRGSLTLDQSGIHQVLAGANGSTLHNGAGHTIEGSGTLGSGGSPMALRNDGTVRATGPQPLVAFLQSPPGASENHGVMEADQGTLILLLTHVTQDVPPAGVIAAGPGGQVWVIGSTVVGGTLRAEADESRRLPPGQVQLQAGARLVDAALEGDVLVTPGAAVFLEGGLQNDGMLRVADVPGGATLLLPGQLQITGAGTLDLGDGGAAQVLPAGPGAALVNGAGHTIRGSGSIGAASGVALINHGALRIPEGGSLACGAFEQDGGETDLRGTLDATGAATLTSGSVTATLAAPPGEPGAARVTAGGAVQLGGTLIIRRPREFRPTPDQIFTLVEGASVQGTFAVVDACDAVELTYGGSTVTLRFLALEGGGPDIDGSGGVDGADLGIVLAQWGPCSECCAADLDGSGAVDGADLGLLLAAWGG